MELVGGEEPRVDESAVSSVVDNRGMLCAQGILRLMRSMLEVPPAGLVKVLSSDPAAEHDYPAWCHATGHHFLGHRREPDARWGALVVSFVKKRAGEPGS
ncbi:MAG TPA: sulfurtransferase TusA family protein [Methylomirabilota bacterium]|jgi:TusA-related sulfurtransferase|nr:sulfurtransferase TusA family protein [Methylomirabilota bacterium]